MASDAVKIYVQEVVKEFQPILVYVTPHSFFSERFSPLKVLYGDLCGLLENNQPVYVPGVESEATASVIYQLCKELEDDQDDFVIVDEGSECLPNDREELWVEPVEKQSEGLLRVETVHDAS